MALSGGTAGANGWYISPPVATYTCADALSGVASCPAPDKLGDGAGGPPRTATDVAGHPSAAVRAVANVDTTAPPAPSIGIPQNGGAYEVGQAYTLQFGCPPDSVSGLAACTAQYGGGAAVGNGAPLDVGEPGNVGSLGNRTVTVTNVNGAGLTSTRSVTYRVVDTKAPSQPVLASPAPDAVTPSRQPTFRWAPSTDGGTGVLEYHINVGGKTYVLPASAAQQAGFQIPDVLVDGTYEWQVFAFDNAGNSSASPKRRFRVDPTAAGAPVITAGPMNGAATSSRTPTFNFTGTPGSTFTWRTLTADDTDVPGGGGSGQPPVTLPSLTDGTYTFSVTQTSPQGQVSEPVVALFHIDTVPPGAPRITAAPTVTGDTRPSFAWTAPEPGGSYTWEVLNATGGVVMGPGTTADTSVRLPSALAFGAFQFHVRQTDPAGNPGAWSSPAAFTVLGTSPSTGSAQRGHETGQTRPKVRHAKFLLPAPGAQVNAKSLKLKWKRVAGASLYNVQVFRLNGMKYTKVFSAFPRTLSVKVPPKKLRPGQRYAWRVWPFMARLGKYTPQPFGISWFDTRRATAR
ncbi:MAG: Ig-like domain-containing protein [Thermoleophilia bacterium]